MILARVEGTVVATAHHPSFDGHKLLIVQPLDEGRQPAGTSFLAVDRVQAGVGDVVLVNREGNGNRAILKQGPITPIRSVIVGVVDAVTPDEGAGRPA
jgi:microcompartment protein CcmK/EutM